MISWFLDPAKWDTCLDTSGRVAICSEPYRIVQDVATACRTFVGDLWWNTAAGVPNATILNDNVSIAYCQAQYEAAALTVPDVVSAQAFLSVGPQRVLTGQVQVVDSNGGTWSVAV